MIEKGREKVYIRQRNIGKLIEKIGENQIRY